ncbi:MAG: hypothetical protein ACI8XB_000088 [Patiriisocius sp.]|jgi:hypothetical protein
MRKINIKKITIRAFSIALTVLFFNSLSAQDSLKVRVSGEIFDFETQLNISYFMIINKSTGSGTFGDADGSFVLNTLINDTILVGAYGYTTQNFVVPTPDTDIMSVTKKFYLKKLALTLPEVVIIPERELSEIKQDIDDLGFNEKDYRVSGVNAIEHPITFLYQMFSKRERSFRKVVELENEERRRDLLKELFEKYVDYDIINLADEDFDDFIDYCKVSDQLLQSTTQYEFINLIKTRYKGFQIYSKRRKASPVYQKIHNE